MDDLNIGQKIASAIIIALIVTGIGYLLCSLFSWSFDRDAWNLVSRGFWWIVLSIDSLLGADVMMNLFHSDDRY